ncbi:hypothetical protein [Helicobacter sp. 13S00477-4]|uniref:hypothetical protein n=1 Tax=Helicobacter sp. 13S00477-4 TaxID=1905759 RepID=UPI000BA679C6|nr:hypothetical protein [Helicobacter sp. 13S00477-4]PAF50701.1 hypothetical protein BKH44_07120 [Helicobacter sp. 13S00477-4]
MQVFDIKNRLEPMIVKKIFSNTDIAKEFLKRFLGSIKIDFPTKSQDIYNLIVENWNYQKALPIVRELFRETKKFKRGLHSENMIKILLEEWKNLDFGKIDWPFSQGAFDAFVQKINSGENSRNIKDDEVKLAAVKYRRIKEINTERNDFLESLIFEKNENIIPTLSHNRGVDFFINGISFDQKVSRSVTDKFKKDFKENWKHKAIENPKLVIKYLYEQQDEGRFGYTPRLYIVYLDEEILPMKIKETIAQTNLNTPLDITFTYKHKNIGTKTYKTQAFIILLHNL